MLALFLSGGCVKSQHAMTTELLNEHRASEVGQQQEIVSTPNGYTIHDKALEKTIYFNSDVVTSKPCVHSLCNCFQRRSTGRLGVEIGLKRSLIDVQLLMKALISSCGRALGLGRPPCGRMSCHFSTQRPPMASVTLAMPHQTCWPKYSG